MQNDNNLLLINEDLEPILKGLKLVEIHLDGHFFYYFGLPTDLSYFNFLKKETNYSLLQKNKTQLSKLIPISDFIQKYKNTSFFNNPNYKLSFNPLQFCTFFNHICHVNNSKEIDYVLEQIPSILHMSQPFSILDKPFSKIAFLKLLKSPLWKNKTLTTRSINIKNLSTIFNKIVTTHQDSYESFHNFIFSFPKIFKNTNSLISIKKFVENNFPHKLNEFIQQIPTSNNDITQTKLITEPTNLINLCINKEILYSHIHKDGIIDQDLYWKKLQTTANYLLKISELKIADVFVQGFSKKSLDYYIIFVIKPNSELNYSIISNIFLDSYLLNFNNKFNDSNIQSIISYYLLENKSNKNLSVKNNKMKL